MLGKYFVYDNYLIYNVFLCLILCDKKVKNYFNSVFKKSCKYIPFFTSANPYSRKKPDILLINFKIICYYIDN